MSKTEDPAKPVPDSEKFKPQNVSGAGKDTGRNERNMDDVARGSEDDRRRAAQDRGGKGRNG
ncbi:hypothetical protein M3P36_12115 [Altererythrobacter sp. KTW20L]|uniref:hypothetical protein n=1 Tax=Altererythrobacter sp. KTW20L TaxID=2942210 RepID=UPI0020BFBA59|nr:hypothetical protein [Altererythrobacter sp. KTW20L]MCL6251783.1 hypothetical protein [Altererythrobacter sp. KTW20L]